MWTLFPICSNIIFTFINTWTINCFKGRIFLICCNRLRKDFWRKEEYDLVILRRRWFVIRAYITWSIYLRNCRWKRRTSGVWLWYFIRVLFYRILSVWYFILQNFISMIFYFTYDFLSEFILQDVFATGTVAKAHLLVISKNDVYFFTNV